ncbi:MAG: fumarate hydratase [Candidatus Omnitrophica bacterium CG08_land_8_20_14_0_20_41_16]|uniref:Fumarate hydratase n=1 Tax=Candidatus Sherwoodlollariibacterium unditelluris TaxID=1974757 RepID=A0A2G9YKK5_9BACT|nr:MAG: fumarate hydratase [Candidatus Omnitrophica bacterium CG23_combo_of_CG06-09_8_20_14_all_41_10]PIS33311.1 MAG: fumarate hydratase [Candidatus Omnitrophica bacterium CG08_land_8_20_14_0_20_41_16]
MKILNAPIQEKYIRELKAGDEVTLSGTIYTVRDQAHKRLIQDIGRGKELPFDTKGAVIYYCGPAKAPKGRVIGSCGPTTSSRMDEFTPLLLKKELKAMIGKGRRSKEVIAAIKKYKAVYFLAPAGCGALISKYIKKAETVAYPDLGPEQILKLEVKGFPLIVGIDSQGGSIYDKD